MYKSILFLVKKESESDEYEAQLLEELAEYKRQKEREMIRTKLRTLKLKDEITKKTATISSDEEDRVTYKTTTSKNSRQVSFPLISSDEEVVQTTRKKLPLDEDEWTDECDDAQRVQWI
jgi:hypothetical protein